MWDACPFGGFGVDVQIGEDMSVLVGLCSIVHLVV
jgi:hypothetical protein